MDRTPITTPSETDRVLVTGAAGFIGSHLVEALLGAGHSVVGVDRRVPADNVIAATNLADCLGDAGFTFIPLDVAADDLNEVVGQCATVFHLAAIPGVRASWGARFDEYVTANILGTARVLDACARAGVARLVFASSSSVYGSAEGPSRETDPTRPISPYGVTKLAAEQLCLAHAGRADSALTACAVRYFTVYGPRQRADMAIGRVLTAALDEVPIDLYGNGGQRREFTYVSDVVAATMAAARMPAPPPIVNVGGGTSVTMNDVLKIAEELTGRTVPTIPAAAQAGDVAATEADLTIARATLDYRPVVGLEEGMARHADWLRSLGPKRRSALMHPNGLMHANGGSTCAS